MSSSGGTIGGARVVSTATPKWRIGERRLDSKLRLRQHALVSVFQTSPTSNDQYPISQFNFSDEQVGISKPVTFSNFKHELKDIAKDIFTHQQTCAIRIDEDQYTNLNEDNTQLAHILSPISDDSHSRNSTSSSAGDYIALEQQTAAGSQDLIDRGFERLENEGFGLFLTSNVYSKLFMKIKTAYLALFAAAIKIQIAFTIPILLKEYGRIGIANSDTSNDLSFFLNQFVRSDSKSFLVRNGKQLASQLYALTATTQIISALEIYWGLPRKVFGRVVIDLTLSLLPPTSVAILIFSIDSPNHFIFFIATVLAFLILRYLDSKMRPRTLLIQGKL